MQCDLNRIEMSEFRVQSSESGCHPDHVMLSAPVYRNFSEGGVEAQSKGCWHLFPP
jgi:hypothetical protein